MFESVCYDAERCLSLPTFFSKESCLYVAALSYCMSSVTTLVCVCLCVPRPISIVSMLGLGLGRRPWSYTSHIQAKYKKVWRLRIQWKEACSNNPLPLDPHR